jgi:hypothetical protein
MIFKVIQPMIPRILQGTYGYPFNRLFGRKTIGTIYRPPVNARGRPSHQYSSRPITMASINKYLSADEAAKVSSTRRLTEGTLKPDEIVFLDGRSTKNSCPKTAPIRSTRYAIALAITLDLSASLLHSNRILTQVTFYIYHLLFIPIDCDPT